MLFPFPLDPRAQSVMNVFVVEDAGTVERYCLSEDIGLL